MLFNRSKRRKEYSDLIIAIESADFPKVKEFFGDGYDLFSHCKEKVNPLELSISLAVNSNESYQYAEIINFLIKKGADVNQKDARGNPIIFGICDGIIINYEILDLLINKGLDIEARNENGETLFLYACKCHSEYLVNYLIEKGANVNAKVEKKFTSLNSLLTKKIKFELPPEGLGRIDRIYRLFTVVDALDLMNEGYLSSSLDLYKIIVNMIQSGYQRKRDQYTSNELAIIYFLEEKFNYSNALNLYKYFVSDDKKSGQKFSLVGDTVYLDFIYAIRDANVELVNEYILKGIDLNTRKEKLRTPLIEVCDHLFKGVHSDEKKGRYLEILSLLIDNGVNLQLTKEDDLELRFLSYQYMKAATISVEDETFNTEVYDILIDNGFPIESSEHNLSLFVSACNSGSYQAISYFISKGALVNVYQNPYLIETDIGLELNPIQALLNIMNGYGNDYEVNEAEAAIKLILSNGYMNESYTGKRGEKLAEQLISLNKIELAEFVVRLFLSRNAVNTSINNSIEENAVKRKKTISI